MCWCVCAWICACSWALHWVATLKTQCLIQTRYTTAERRFIRDFLIDHEAKLEDEAKSKILDDNRQLTNIRRAGARCLCPLALTSLTTV